MAFSTRFGVVGVTHWEHDGQLHEIGTTDKPGTVGFGALALHKQVRAGGAPRGGGRASTQGRVWGRGLAVVAVWEAGWRSGRLTFDGSVRVEAAAGCTRGRGAAARTGRRGRRASGQGRPSTAGAALPPSAAGAGHGHLHDQAPRRAERGAVWVPDRHARPAGVTAGCRPAARPAALCKPCVRESSDARPGPGGARARACAKKPGGLDGVARDRSGGPPSAGQP